jgi:hypothetical protein
MGVRIKLAIVGLAILLQVGGVLLLFGPMAPIEEGTSAEFWRLASGVDLDGQHREVWGSIYPPRDGWYFYYVQGYHGQFLYRVKRADADRDFPAVLARIEQERPATNASPPRSPAHAVLNRHRPSVDHDPERFVSLVQAEIRQRIRSKDERVYHSLVADDQAFADRWSRIQRYWLNAVVEIGFFASLTLFAPWPWMRRGIKWKWSLHLALLPLLLFLPFYMGYAAWTFTSVGPSGGILYPWVIVWFRGIPPWTPVDRWLLEHFPKVLEPLSQTLGQWLSYTGGQPLGLVAAMVIGVVIAGLIWGIRNLLEPKADCLSTKRS